MTQQQAQNILSVTQLNRYARTVLESEIGRVWVSAEISNFVAASSGHWYFTLKDKQAQVRAAMFKNANRYIMQRPKEGDKVLVRASISLYEARGDYQLIVEHLEQDGEGLLKLQFEKLKQQLTAEGLFAAEHKQPLPDIINRIGVVTSASGAAFHDILTVLKRRNPATEVILYPSQVQGQGATAQIVTAIQTANARNEVDVLIVGRGGGSLEDLWCFNEEPVARAIFNSRLPVISAVGHEVDITIADFVADIRAATPSAAAELASTDQSHLRHKVEQSVKALQQHVGRYLQQQHHQQQLLEHKLQQNHPAAHLQQHSQWLDQLHIRLQHSMDRKVHQSSTILARQRHKLEQQQPDRKLKEAKRELSQLETTLKRNIQQLLKQKQQQLASSSHLLDSVSPLATMARGYNIAFKDGELVKKKQQLQPGDTITSRFVDGDVTSKVL